MTAMIMDSLVIMTAVFAVAFIAHVNIADRRRHARLSPRKQRLEDEEERREMQNW